MIKYKVSNFIPKVGFLIEKYIDGIKPENRSDTFSCIVSFNAAGLPIQEADFERASRDYATEICKALNILEKLRKIARANKAEKKKKQNLAKQGYLTLKEFMKNAKPSTFFKDVQADLERERNDPKIQKQRQAAEAKRMAGIAEIMNKFVGAEE
jgi:hypothetical protein